MECREVSWEDMLVAVGVVIALFFAGLAMLSLCEPRPTSCTPCFCTYADPVIPLPSPACHILLGSIICAVFTTIITILTKET